MNNKVNFQFLSSDTRARVYALWAVLTTVGWVATHYYQNHLINGVWFVISVIGLGYMFKVMPLRVRQMRLIFASWLIPITIGMTVSGLVFYVPAISGLIQYLGAFWLIVMAVGYFANGLVDAPSKWYYFAAALNFIVGVLCFVDPAFTAQQYLLAAIVSFWSMSYLWLLRSEA